jgi:uncharacterized protein YegJ (DUF2314 family)
MSRLSHSFLIAFFVLPCAVSAQSIVEKAKQDEIAFAKPNDPDMAAAFEKARSTLGTFLVMAKAPPPQFRSVAVKVAVVDRGATEYFWITPFSETSSGYSGVLNNQPRLVSNVTMGAQLQFNRESIVDWMYIDSSTRQMHGNFTACALLKKEPHREAENMKRQFGLDCDRSQETPLK